MGKDPVRMADPESRTIPVILFALAGVCLIGMVCLVVAGVAGVGFFSTAGVERGSATGSGLVIAGNNVQVGAPAPDFVLQAVDGETHALSDYHGQVVFINFWATWCPPCEAEMPTIESTYEAYQDEGFVVLAINAGESPGLIRDFRHEEGLTFPLLMDPGESVADTYNIRALPTSVLLDQDGIIHRIYPGPITYGQLSADVESLLR
jgi:peroxiredoxin